jgi:hypothetical protein
MNMRTAESTQSSIPVAKGDRTARVSRRVIHRAEVLSWYVVSHYRPVFSRPKLNRAHDSGNRAHFLKGRLGPFYEWLTIQAEHHFADLPMSRCDELLPVGQGQ